jgi:hypothetical protein
VGHDRALGQAGGAGGVGLERLRVRGELRRLGKPRASISFCFVLVERDAVRHRAGDGHRVRVRVRIDERGAALGIFENELQRVARKPRVDGDGNGTGAHRAEENLEKLDAVADDHADALAGLDTEAPHEAGDAVRALVELGVGDLAFAAAPQVDDGDLVGEAAHRIGEEITEVGFAVHCPR